jgi:cytochrome c peroxidase
MTMISRKTGLVIFGSALLLAACHKTETTTDTNVAETSNASMEDLGNVDNASDAANATDELDNGDRTNSDTRGKPAPSAQ